MHRFKIEVHVKPIILTGTKGEHIVMQEENFLIFKRYGETEDAVKEILKPQLLEFYGNDYEFVSVKNDPTYHTEEETPETTSEIIN